MAAALVAANVGVLPAGPAHAATPTVRQDFNGDGYGDLAVAAPDATVNGRAKAGYVAVLYGSANGLRTTAKKVYTQASAGIPGTVEAGDRFGSDLVTADLDGDGYSDLQVSADDERWEQGGIAREGSRTVLWGGPGTGDFNGDGHQTLLDDGRVEYGPFGRGGQPAGTTGAQLVDGDLDLVRVVADDVDGDGITDLVTLARSFDADDEGNRGEHLNFLRGGRHGLRPLVALRNAQGERIRPGHTPALGDVNGDHRDDIVMGHGRLSFLYSTASGPADSVASRTITQDTPGMPGIYEAGDVLGYDLAVGDINGDGHGDVLAGDPYEDLGTVQQAGAFGAGTLGTVASGARLGDRFPR
ncbi:integrin alpha [Streptomyces sp. NPDC048384]|uniref:integrin alpha n=2 Tax=unclassified Streptomyces TaxID=2593676 RepID=UPI003431B6F3